MTMMTLGVAPRKQSNLAHWPRECEGPYETARRQSRQWSTMSLIPPEEEEEEKENYIIFQKRLERRT